MDWDTFHRKKYLKNVDRLDFEPRPAKCFSVQGCGSQLDSLPTSVLIQDLPDEESMQHWLGEQREKSANNSVWPKWSLTILALQRGPPNEFEKRREGAVDQLTNVGCTRATFDAVIDIFNISKAFPECFEKDGSMANYWNSTLSSKGDGHIDVILRSDHANLQDLAFGLSYSAETANTFVLLHGCTNKVFKELTSWLNAMKDYAGHPLLMVNLFLELHRRRVAERYRYLLGEKNTVSFVVFEFNKSDVSKTVSEHIRNMVDKINTLSDQVGVLGHELIELRARLPDIKLLYDEGGKDALPTRNEYMLQHGDLLKANLARLERQIESLQAKNAHIKSTLELMFPSIFNMIAMKDSQTNKEMAAAGRRDSSVMVGITVGTLTFFPCTTIATIFAMPIFNWNAAPSEKVTDHRFWIYLAVTIPITAITLLTLAIWLSLADKASKEFMSVRDYAKKFNMKQFVQSERRRISARLKTTESDAEKAMSTHSALEP